ncbi:hypothetical protein APHNP_0405 [Anaplasma phagocytophilum str. ApNP]|uniref:Uncharacterized protein n=2 Tax=Anaplasma phagocytophilum TaxID=948 RepID=A0A0F3NGB1_ANAPH|nr:hypothetical protein APHMUC_0608 [Anaplasma phagocytophilum str. ApMUC09]KJV66816.1 hypothetical protein APHNP_0405 [Anaplasma phagocytophilum str. ApNP]
MGNAFQKEEKRVAAIFASPSLERQHYSVCRDYLSHAD